MNKTFSSPVDASRFIAGAGTATGASIRQINYVTGEVQFSLITAAGPRSEVNGLTVPDVTEATVAAAIRAEIASK